MRRSVSVGSLILLCAVLSVILAGCSLLKGKKSPVSEKKIQSDLAQETEVSNLLDRSGTEISEVEVLKRQTVTEDHIDKVWVKVALDGEEVSGEVYYKIEYGLYNEGWMLDSVIDDKTEKWIFVPKEKPDEHVINKLFADRDKIYTSDYDKVKRELIVASSKEYSYSSDYGAVREYFLSEYKDRDFQRDGLLEDIIDYFLYVDGTDWDEHDLSIIEKEHVRFAGEYQDMNSGDFLQWTQADREFLAAVRVEKQMVQYGEGDFRLEDNSIQLWSGHLLAFSDITEKVSKDYFLNMFLDFLMMDTKEFPRFEVALYQLDGSETNEEMARDYLYWRFDDYDKEYFDIITTIDIESGQFAFMPISEYDYFCSEERIKDIENRFRKCISEKEYSDFFVSLFNEIRSYNSIIEKNRLYTYGWTTERIDDNVDIVAGRYIDQSDKEKLIKELKALSDATGYSVMITTVNRDLEAYIREYGNSFFSNEIKRINQSGSANVSYDGLMIMGDGQDMAIIKYGLADEQLSDETVRKIIKRVTPYFEESSEAAYYNGIMELISAIYESLGLKESKSEPVLESRDEKKDDKGENEKNPSGRDSYNENNYRGIANGTVNVRSGPGVEYDILYDTNNEKIKLYSQEEVTIIDEAPSSEGKIWYYVKFEREGVTYKGYVTSSYISKDEGRGIRITPTPTPTPSPSPAPIDPETLTFKMPAVLGLEVKDAISLLKKYSEDLTITYTEEEFSNEYPQGTVCAQYPPVGIQVDKYGTVKLTISAGKELVQLPDVTNRDYDSAIAILEAYGFGVIPLYEYSDSVGEGRVIRTEPELYSMLEKWSEVVVYISLGAEP